MGNDAEDLLTVEKLKTQVEEHGYCVIPYKDDEEENLQTMFKRKILLDSDEGVDFHLSMTTEHSIVKPLLESSLDMATLTMCMPFNENAVLKQRIVSICPSELKNRSLVLMLLPKGSVGTVYPDTYRKSTQRQLGQLDVYHIDGDAGPGVPVNGAIVVLDGCTGISLLQGWADMIAYVKIESVEARWGIMVFEHADSTKVLRFRTERLGARFKVVHEGTTLDLSKPLGAEVRS